MLDDPPTKGCPVAFFGLTFLLSLPFYILNALACSNVLFKPEMGALYVSLFTLTPIASASILIFRRGGWDGVKKLLWRIFDFRRIANNKWYAPIFLLVPLIFLLTLGVMAFFGAPIPAGLVPVVALPAVMVFFFILAAGEEVGWTGYAFGPMEARGGALRASLVLGLIWAIWHVPFFVFMMPEAIVFTAQVVTLVSTRVLIAWVYNNSGRSVFAATLFHAAGNALMITLPDSSTTGALGPAISCGLVLSAAVVVTLLWGAQTLARYRFGAQV